ncbi:MAG: EAL domain-containing protein [Oscillospiraceae bacterium]|nr:EAL domain-containing protein [Oscillospiraceae bacterium]
MEWLFILIIAVLAIVAVVMFVAFARIKKKAGSLERRLNALYNASNKYIMLWKDDLSYVYVNDALRMKLFSLGANADAGFVLSVFDSEKTPDKFSPATLIVNALDESGTESVFNDLTGNPCYIKWRSDSVEVKGVSGFIMSVGSDETELRYLKNELYKQRRDNFISEENFEMAMESAEIGIIHISTHALPYIEMSPVGKKMLGFNSIDDITLEDLKEKVYAVDLNNYEHKLKNLLNGNSSALEIEIKMLSANNEYHNFMLKWNGTKDEFGTLTKITGAFIDVTSQRERYSLYDAVSLLDPMSGLYNRKGFMEKGSELLALLNRNKENENFGNAVMASIKIERMLKITSLFGNEMWERLIKCYAEGLVKFTGENSVAGRIGTDDFALIIASDNPYHDIEAFTKELFLFLENNCDDNTLPANLKDQVRFDAGICIYDGMDDIQTLYYKANIMLYASSEIGNKICHYYNDDVEKKLHDRELIEFEIGHALKYNEFELYYQPKVSFRTGEIIGAEALIRWNHPKRGIIYPYEFIPVAEDIGIIIKMDEWGLKQACNQNKYWQVKGYRNIKVSVNMSQIQLYKTNVVETLKRALDESGLEPQYIEIELTETMAVQDIKHTIRVLENIKKLGVSISMDDFGTGYSSLSSIKQLPIDILKVDRSLIHDLCDNPASENIARAVIEMGKAMNFLVVAEGVETQEQWDILNKLGCDEAQGYFHGKPLSAADIEKKFLMADSV